MALERPLYMQPASGDPSITYTAQQDRANLLASVFSREGVLDPDAGQLRVTQRGAGANMSVDIAIGRCAIQGDDASDQGMYVCSNTTVVNRNTFSTGSAITAPGSGSRTHRVIARVRDKLHNGGFTTYEWVIEILQDTGSGIPALPASAISLASITISAGNSSITNAMITDLRPYASVGTPARTGTLTSYDGVTWNATDSARPPRWSVNSDGWVTLGGFLRYVGANFTFTGGFGDLLNPLPADILPLAGGFRDMACITSFGPQQLTARLVSGSWRLSFWTATSIPFIGNSTWVSLDGCGWRK